MKLLILLALIHSHKYSNFFEQVGCEKTDETCSEMFEDENGYFDHVVSSDTLYTFSVALNCQYRTYYRKLDRVLVDFKDIPKDDFKQINFKDVGRNVISPESFEWDLCRDKVR